MIKNIIYLVRFIINVVSHFSLILLIKLQRNKNLSDYFYFTVPLNYKRLKFVTVYYKSSTCTCRFKCDYNGKEIRIGQISEEESFQYKIFFFFSQCLCGTVQKQVHNFKLVLLSGRF